jgi:outer membrane protein OmpA-like peptidoglycan-associated protein
MSSQDEDQGSKAGLVVAFGAVALAVVVALSMAVRHSFKSAAAPLVAQSASAAVPAPSAAVAASPAASADAGAGADQLVDLTPTGAALSTVFFGSGQAALDAAADAALAKVVEALAGSTSKKVLLSGYHDTTGDPARNAELAKERAKAVRAALVAKGVPLAQVLLRKPEVTAGGGSDQEARRVEIRVIDAP